MRIDLTSVTAAAVLNDTGQAVAQANQAQRKTAANADPVTAQQAPQADLAAAVQRNQQSERNQLPQNQPPDQLKQAASTVKVPPAIPAPEVMNVTFDQNHNTIYRFVDEKSGDLVRQVPPEEVLRVMRNVEEMMQESEQKLKVTL